MNLTLFVTGSSKLGTILVSGLILLFLDNDIYRRPNFLFYSNAKEIEVTKDWQMIGENDTIPAGMHVRMDLTTGGKWVKLMDKDGDEQEKDVTKRNSAVSTVIVEEDGATRIQDGNNLEINENIRSNGSASVDYNYEIMHRTLSKLPDEEKELMGGLPELPLSNEAESSKIAFKQRMIEIWKLRQERLVQLQESVINFPEVLKMRIASIEKYLEDPLTQLISINLDESFDGDGDGDADTHIVSVLKDLEYQLSDIDMARDFHSMGGWPFLVQLVPDESHFPSNKTIQQLSRSIQTKIRTVQAHAAWAIGTAVKNTEEFFPYSVERILVSNGKITTPIELLVDSFCKEYNDSSSWDIRTLLSKNVYAIGAILRGNALAQTHVVNTDGFDRLGKKYNALSQEGFNSVHAKLIQKLAVLSIYIVQDSTDTDIIRAITSSDFCDATCGVLSSGNFLPVTVQETILRAFAVLGPHCQQSSCAVSDFQSIIETIRSDWLKRKDDFDDDHFQEMLDVASIALNSINGEH